MDLSRTAELTDFRERARTWLEENVPSERRPSTPGPDVRAYDAAWQRVQYDGGWAGINWPAEYGGRGLPLLEQVVWYEELVRARAPHAGIFGVALSHAGPTLIARGTTDQKNRHLTRILNGATPWCQGFSEPESGSDLASIRCRGEVDGDSLVINGSKIWTSYGEHADYCELLIRTEPGSIRHRGLSWVVLDMHLPGIEIRPIPSIDGWPHNCAVFLDEVRVPLDQVVGGLGEGWSVAMTTLAAERGPGFLDERLAQVVLVDDLIERARATGRLREPGVWESLAELRAGAAAVRSMAYRLVSQQDRGMATGSESVAIRSFYVQLQMRTAAAAIALLGPESLILSPQTTAWLEAFSGPIAGGTIDIQKNIIGERVLGLPR
jgi:alkylation response protein AidB-like acyl-CoA dehydrogenase